MTRLHQWDVLRANKAPFAFGLETRVPFLDKQFLQVRGGAGRGGWVGWGREEGGRCHAGRAKRLRLGTVCQPRRCAGALPVLPARLLAPCRWP